MIKYNFNINKKTGKTYYEQELNWKELKRTIKTILDEKSSCKEVKIDKIISRLKHYKETYIDEYK